MKKVSEFQSICGVAISQIFPDGGYAEVYLHGVNHRPATVIFSWGGGWDHVSVSYPNRCPTWEEMSRIKDIFFRDTECAVEYHPPKADYVNNHPYCLHLWRPQAAVIPMPPKEFV